MACLYSEETMIEPDSSAFPAADDSTSEEMVCFCFGYTRGDIVDDLAANGRSTILEHIAKEKKSGACRCVEKNPKKR